MCGQVTRHTHVAGQSDDERVQTSFLTPIRRRMSIGGWLQGDEQRVRVSLFDELKENSVLLFAVRVDAD